jgi:hypothetical protein
VVVVVVVQPRKIRRFARRDRSRRTQTPLGRRNGNADGKLEQPARPSRAGSILPFFLSPASLFARLGAFTALRTATDDREDIIVDDRRLATAVALGSLSY